MYSFNAVYVICDKLGETMFYGKGAGDLPTGSAVVNDIASIAKIYHSIKNLNMAIKF